MKNVALLILLLSPLSLFAQMDDMFYVPKKEVKAGNVSKILSAQEDEWGVADNGNTRDVDEYNRRGAYNAETNSISADAVESIVVNNYQVDDCDDYDCSTRIVRFHNPVSVVVTSYDYYDYPSVYYYDDWYWGTRLGWSCSWDGFGIGFSTGWHYPYYYNHPHYWHPAPAPHHSVAHSPRSVRGRVPVADVRGGSGGGARRPVAEPGKGSGGRVPVAQVNGGGRKDNSVNSDRGENKKTVSASEKRGSVRQESKSGSVRRNSNATYSRPSSTGVRKSSSSGGSRSSSVSRGGRARGSRR